MRILFFSSLILTACTGLNTPPPEKKISLNIPATYREAANNQNTRISHSWLPELRDSRLSRLVEEALKYNHTLQGAAARLRSVKQGTIIGRSITLPSITTSANTAGNYSGFSNESSENYSLSLNASWEPDLWGRLRNLEKANYYDFESAVADFRSAKLSLVANTARSYLNLISAQQQVDLAETTLTSFKKNFRIIERNYKAGTGDARDLDIAFGRNNVASAERALIARKLERDEAARSLEILLGRYPAAEIKASPRLPTLSQNIPAGLPATLLERRPDLAAARATVYASAERAEASRKNLLPDLRLTSGVNSSPGNSFSRLLNPDFLLYSAAASLSQTLYSGGRLSAQAQQALESNRIALKNYAQSALIAFREVESALDTELSLAKQETFLITEVDKAALAERFAERAYIEGGNILSVLEAQRRVNNARANLIALKNQRLQNRIDLHLALGGSY